MKAKLSVAGRFNNGCKCVISIFLHRCFLGARIAQGSMILIARAAAAARGAMFTWCNTHPDIDSIRQFNYVAAWCSCAPSNCPGLPYARLPYGSSALAPTVPPWASEGIGIAQS